MTDYSKLIKDYHAGLTDPNIEVPEQMGRFLAQSKACSEKRELSEKFKELIALAIAMSVQCDVCIKHHAGAALRAGVTQNEIGALIGLATTMGCGPSSVYGVEALRAYDDFPAKAG